MAIRYLKQPLRPLHAPHVHQCREDNCPNIQVCQDADRCRVPKDWLCGSCADALEEQQNDAMAEQLQREQENRK